MREKYISVDIEASGPIPGEYSMLTIGACVVDAEDTTLYAKLKPLNQRVVPEAMRVSDLTLEELERMGRTPADAMSAFRDWITQATLDGTKSDFVGLNAPFDWSFVNYYFHRFVGETPFGFTALDIKAFYMGATGCTWDQQGPTTWQND
jgi:DNA polymerase III epsilon subunit-like protein